ncbi:MAG: DUF2905 domain-containing protein [Chlorobi bacterium]|nr:DUF2905 domain-containing protein [Chlorobiota bacterium]
MTQLAKILIGTGLFIALMGVLLWISGNLFSWFGKLPGDIRIERENFVFYAPITSMILVSIVLNLILYIASKIFFK